MAPKSYAFSRDTLASMRLYFQHWMWRYQTGYLLHPTILIRKEGLKVADVACGTGMWLIELARTLPANAQLDGFDISAEQFPPKEWTPSNIALQTLDCLAPLPDHLVGKYDIVHVGMVVMLIRNEDPTALIKNLIAMLKPEGYLQWDEVDCGSFHPIPTNPSMPHPFYDKLLIAHGVWLSKRGITFQWVGDINTLLAAQSLDVLSHQRLPISDALKKPWTDMQLMATNDINESYVIPTLAKDASPNAEEFREMFTGMAEECKQGMSITMDMIVVVGKKKL